VFGSLSFGVFALLAHADISAVFSEQNELNWAETPFAKPAVFH